MPKPKRFVFKRAENRHANNIPVAEWMELRASLRDMAGRPKGEQISLIGTHILNHVNGRRGNRISSEDSNKLAEEIYERGAELIRKA